MTKKQKIIVSTTGIFLVLLILVGLTYAYFLTRIKGNTNEKSISVSTANLILEYADIEDVVVGGENVEPGTTWTKKFSATNKGSKKVEYGVALENVLNTLERTKDLVYTLNCTSSLGTDCNKVEDEQEFPVIGTILITNDIESEEVQSYELIVSYKEQNEDQSVDMNKKIYAKANIVNPSTFGALGSGTLASKIIDSAKKASEKSYATRTKFGTRVTEFTSISGENERVLNNAPDDYGISYYFRGNVLDNYVSFSTYSEDIYAGYMQNSGIEHYYKSLLECQNDANYNNDCTLIHKKGDPIIWRIVRINGDGSIKIATNDALQLIEFNSNRDDNAYVGYMYGMTNQTETNVNQCIKLNSDGTSAEVDITNTTEETCIANGGKWAPTPYDATHVNVVSSTIKTTLENWYKTNIVDTNNSNYVADTLFCNDKTLASSSIGENNTAKGYGKNQTYYSSMERLKYSSGITYITTSKPTFECAENAKNTYSRYTVSETTLLNGNKTNGNLTYPIGLLSADEVAYAGAYAYSQENLTYYLHTLVLKNTMWLMSPNLYLGTGSASEGFVGYNNGVLNFVRPVSTSNFSIHPVINLKNDTLLYKGDGTEANPYQIKLQTE